MEKIVSGEASGVIWISGFSAAGKTTVGRNLVSLLRSNGVKTIHLDGDDLRAIFGDQFGFQRAERVELARAYFRLCSHLAAQQNTVVISAVAMYQEIRDWIRIYMPKTLEVHLEVNDSERRLRDKKLKNIYPANLNLESLYDHPDELTFIIDNQGNRSIDTVSKEIYDSYLSMGVETLDLGRDSHWAKFYAAGVATGVPSSFAVSVASQLNGLEKVFEIGCGNGRDAEFFGKQGFSVTATDSSITAITNCKSQFHGTNVKYYHHAIDSTSPLHDSYFDVAYCRFVIHAMPLSEECVLHENVFNKLKSGGKYFIECRSINDPMAYKGEIISSTERIFGHYRRFIVLADLIKRLAQAGFVLESSLEATDLANFGDENPMVIRVTASKK